MVIALKCQPILTNTLVCPFHRIVLFVIVYTEQGEWSLGTNKRQNVQFMFMFIYGEIARAREANACLCIGMVGGVCVWLCLIKV